MFSDIAKNQISIKDKLSKENLPFSTTYEMFKWCADRYEHLNAIKFQHTAEIDSPIDKLSYRELFQKITQAANLFSSFSENSPIVSYILPNLPQTHFTIWGAEEAGIVNAINPFLESDKIFDILETAKSTILVTLAPALSPELWDKIVKVIKKSSQIETILLVGIDEINHNISKQVDIPVISFDMTLAQQNNLTLNTASTTASNDIAAYFHTGGTTGTPKVAQQTHANQIANALSLTQFYSGNVGDVCLVGLPLFHVNAVIGTGLAAFMKGNCIVLLTAAGYRTPNILVNFWQYVKKYKATIFSCVPTILTALL